MLITLFITQHRFWNTIKPYACVNSQWRYC